jgi:hypothetical protein
MLAGKWPAWDRQGVRLEPLLQAICDFLVKQPALIERVRRDLVRGLV